MFGRRSWNHSNLYPNKGGIKKRPRAYMTDYYTDQDKFLSMMIEAYENKEIPCWYVFKPYFDWKKGKRSPRFNPIELREMYRTAIRERDKFLDKYPDAIYVGRFEPSDPFSLYKGYGSDCNTMAFISTISEEIINMAILGHTPL